MKMKLSLAAALAHRPRLLILDEATAGLDPVVRDEILDEFLGFIQDEEHAILISSHITSDLEKVGRLYHLHPPGPGGALGQPRTTFWSTTARLGCTAGPAAATWSPADLVRVRKGSFGCEALVRDRAAFARKYPEPDAGPGDAGGYHAL